MDLTDLRVIITILATLIAVIFILLTFIFPEYSVLVLTIETILLPAIYIIGNYYAERYIQKQNSAIISDIRARTEELDKRYIKEQMNNIRLETALKTSSKKWQRKK